MKDEMGESLTIVLHNIPIPPNKPPPPFPFPLTTLLNPPNNSPTHNPQPPTQRPSLLYAHIAQFLPVRARGEQNVPTGNGRVVEEGEDVLSGEEEVECWLLGWWDGCGRWLGAVRGGGENGRGGGWGGDVGDSAEGAGELGGWCGVGRGHWSVGVQGVQSIREVWGERSSVALVALLGRREWRGFGWKMDRDVTVYHW